MPVDDPQRTPADPPIRDRFKDEDPVPRDDELHDDGNVETEEARAKRVMHQRDSTRPAGGAEGVENPMRTSRTFPR